VTYRRYQPRYISYDDDYGRSCDRSRYDRDRYDRYGSDRSYYRSERPRYRDHYDRYDQYERRSPVTLVVDLGRIFGGSHRRCR
jgi:hypothetical protein